MSFHIRITPFSIIIMPHFTCFIFTYFCFPSHPLSLLPFFFFSFFSSTLRRSQIISLLLHNSLENMDVSFYVNTISFLYLTKRTNINSLIPSETRISGSHTCLSSIGLFKNWIKQGP